MDPVLRAVEGRTSIEQVLERLSRLEACLLSEERRRAQVEACWMDEERLLEQALELARRRKAKERAGNGNGHRLLVVPVRGSG